VGPTACLDAVVPDPARTRTSDHPARSPALYDGAIPFPAAFSGLLFTQKNTFRCFLDINVMSFPVLSRILLPLLIS